MEGRTERDQLKKSLELSRKLLVSCPIDKLEEEYLDEFTIMLVENGLMLTEDGRVVDNTRYGC
jgi:hypothetical protein